MAENVTRPADVTFRVLAAPSGQEAFHMDSRLSAPWLALRLGIGLTATLAGLDKFFNLLANWSQYVSPLAAPMLPFSIATFMGIVGVVEVAVGIAVLTAWTRFGAYVASAWLILVAVNLALAGYFDVAVRDVVMAIGAFTLARLTEVRQEMLLVNSQRPTPNFQPLPITNSQ